MKRNLTLILSGLLAFSVQGQQTNQKKIVKQLTSKEQALERDKIYSLKEEAACYVISAEDSLAAASNRLAKVTTNDAQIQQILDRVNSGKETNYRSAIVRIGAFEQDTGMQQEMARYNLKKAQEMFDKAYGTYLEANENNITVLGKSSAIEYESLGTLSEASYMRALKRYSDASAYSEAALLREVLAVKKEQKGSTIRTNRKK